MRKLTFEQQKFASRTIRSLDDSWSDWGDDGGADDGGPHDSDNYVFVSREYLMYHCLLLDAF